MKKIIVALAFMGTMHSYAQSEFQLEVDLGYAFQSEMMFNNERLDGTGAFGIRFGGNYSYIFKNNVYLEIGVFGKYNTSKKRIETLEFSTNNLKLQFPLLVGYKFNDKWKFSAGASIENNQDFEANDLITEDDLRFDLLTKFVYMYTHNVHFSLYTNTMLNSTPDVNTISSPRNGIYLGVIYQFGNK